MMNINIKDTKSPVWQYQTGLDFYCNLDISSIKEEAESKAL